MQNRVLTIFQCFKNTKKLPILDWYHDFLESPSDKLQIRSTLGWSLELVHLSGSGPWTIKRTCFYFFERVIFIKRIWKRSYINTHSLILFLKNLSINYFKHKLKQTFHYFRQESDFFAANTFLFSRHDSTSFTLAPRSMCCSIFATGQFQIAYFFFLWITYVVFYFFAWRILGIKLIW